MDRHRLIALGVAATVVLPAAPADARRIVAASERAEGGIVVIDATDGDRRVLARARYPFGPVWSPRRSRIAFAAAPEAGFEYVSLMSRSGRHERRVTGSGWTYPSSRPNGDLTVACGESGACDQRPGLYLLDPARPERLRRLRGTAGASASAWAPGGRRVAFVSSRHGRGDLFVKRLGRPRLRRLTRSPIDEAAPDWSPDGRWIVYSRPPRHPQQPYDLWLVRPDGRRETRLTQTPANETNPAWSASGRRIVFSTPRGLFTMRRDGTGRRRVTGSRRGDCCPDW